MANIKIVVDGTLMDGHKITFKAPCDCVSVEKLKVCYVENATQKSRLFTMVDSHGNDLTGLGNLFYKDAYVNVVLDTNNGRAYLQNAGTNTYLEQKITPVDNLESDRADLPLSARMGSELNKNLGGLRFGYDGDSNTYGYYGADGSLIPFKSGIPVDRVVTLTDILRESSMSLTTDLNEISIITTGSTSLSPEFVWVKDLGFIVNRGNNWTMYEMNGGSFRIGTAAGGSRIPIIVVGK